MSYVELRDLRTQGGYTKKVRSRFLFCPLAMDQLDRTRARDETETESSAARKRFLMAALQSALVADEEVVKKRGQWRRHERLLGRVARGLRKWGGGGHFGLDGRSPWKNIGQRAHTGG